MLVHILLLNSSKNFQKILKKVLTNGFEKSIISSVQKNNTKLLNMALYPNRQRKRT